MTTQDAPKAIEQEYHYQVDQQVSVNSFIDIDINGENVRFQVTSRYGATPEKIVKTTKAEIDAYILLRQEYPRTLIAPPAPSEPKYVNVDGGGNETADSKTFTVERISIKIEDGHHYYKVMGGKFSKYGCTVWPEVLEAAGLKIDHATGQMNASVNGWTAEYVEFEKDGNKRTKVTRLSPI
jgi:hypothetical protein